MITHLPTCAVIRDMPKGKSDRHNNFTPVCTCDAEGRHKRRQQKLKLACIGAEMRGVNEGTSLGDGNYIKPINRNHY